MGIIIVIFILTLHTALFAQHSYELDVHYGFGASELSFNSVPGIGISIYPIKNFGISAGLEYSWHWQTKTSSPSGSNPPAIDDEGDSLIFKYAIDKYKEEWQGNILQIPILLKYSDDSYYAAAGMKIGIPRNAKANINYKGLKTEGHYFKDSLHLTAPNFQGFGAQKDNSAKTKIPDTKNLIMLAAEGGVKFKLNDNFSLLAGVFADYSLNKSFDRKPPHIIERMQKIDSANLVVNDTWKSWQPWSIGAIVKLSFSFKPNKEELQIMDTTVLEDPNITVKADTLPPPSSVEGQDPQSQELIPPSPIPAPSDSFQVPPLPAFLLNREADFIFHYPETRTSPSDSLHLSLISQIADILRTKINSQLHCVGYSEKLISESVAYETALQRSLRIRYTLSRFYGIDEKRIYIYSQGSKNSGYRRAECFILTNTKELKQ
jgi:hypothetical protein